MASAAWVTALCAVVGVFINSFGWHRHAVKDNDRFSELRNRLGGEMNVKSQER